MGHHADAQPVSSKARVRSSVELGNRYQVTQTKFAHPFSSAVKWKIDFPHRHRFLSGLVENDFDEVESSQFDDELPCTNTDDVTAYLTSTAPGENATTEQLRQLHAEIETRLREGKGILRMTKDSGTFIARRTR